MYVKPSEAGLTNVVKRITAVYTGTDEEDRQANQVLNVVLDAPDPENFTPYEDLTLTQVIGWIEDKVDVAFWQGILDQRIEESLFENLPCPWD